MASMKHLIIFEDGAMSEAEELDEGMTRASDDGLVSIVRFAALHDRYERLHEGEWIALSDD